MRPFAKLGLGASRAVIVASVLLMLAVCAVGTALPMGIGWDFANFYDAGRKIATGQAADLYDPTVQIGGESPQGALSFYGTPISAYFYAPMAYFEPPTAMALFKIQNTMAYATAFLLLALWAGRGVADEPGAWIRFLAAFSTLLVLYQPIWTVFRVGGQSTPTIVLLLAFAVAAHSESRFSWSAAAVTIAVLIKPALGIAYLFLFAVAPKRYRVWALAQLAAVGALSIGLMGVDLHFDFLEKMKEGGLIFPWFFNSSLYVVFGEAGEKLPLAAAVWALKGGAGALTIFAFRRWRAGLTDESDRRAFEVFGAAVFALLLANTVWEHYLTYLLPLWAWGVARAVRLEAWVRWTFLTILALCPLQNIVVIDALRATLAFESAGSNLLMAVLKALPLYLVLLLVWKARPPRQFEA